MYKNNDSEPMKFNPFNKLGMIIDNQGTVKPFLIIDNKMNQARLRENLRKETVFLNRLRMNEKRKETVSNFIESLTVNK